MMIPDYSEVFRAERFRGARRRQEDTVQGSSAGLLQQAPPTSPVISSALHPLAPFGPTNSASVSPSLTDVLSWHNVLIHANWQIITHLRDVRLKYLAGFCRCVIIPNSCREPSVRICHFRLVSQNLLQNG